MWSEEKRIRGIFTGMSAGYIALGLVLMLWPQGAMNVICGVLGAAAVVLGVYKLFRYFTAQGVEVLFVNMSAGVVLLLVGLVLLIRPELLLGLLPILLGLLVVIDGTARVRTALELRRVGYGAWGLELAFSALSVLLGIMLIANPMFSLNLATAFIGAVLCVDGVINLWDIFYVSRQIRNLRR